EQKIEYYFGISESSQMYILEMHMPNAVLVNTETFDTLNFRYFKDEFKALSTNDNFIIKKDNDEFLLMENNTHLLSFKKLPFKTTDKDVLTFIKGRYWSLTLDNISNKVWYFFGNDYMDIYIKNEFGIDHYRMDFYYQKLEEMTIIELPFLIQKIPAILTDSNPESIELSVYNPQQNDFSTYIITEYLSNNKISLLTGRWKQINLNENTENIDIIEFSTDSLYINDLGYKFQLGFDSEFLLLDSYSSNNFGFFNGGVLKIIFLDDKKLVIESNDLLY